MNKKQLIKELREILRNVDDDGIPAYEDKEIEELVERVWDVGYNKGWEEGRLSYQGLKLEEAKGTR